VGSARVSSVGRADELNALAGVLVSASAALFTKDSSLLKNAVWSGIQVRGEAPVVTVTRDQRLSTPSDASTRRWPGLLQQAAALKLQATMGHFSTDSVADNTGAFSIQYNGLLSY
jgi:hypothetical protein